MLVLGKFSIPETIVVRGDRKSRPKKHCKTMHNIFASSSEKERLNFLPFHWPRLRAHTMLQHSLHCALGSGFASCSSYQIWLAMQYNMWIADLSTSRIFPRIGAWTNVIFRLLYQRLLELNFKYTDYETLAYLSYSSYVCWTSARETRAQSLLSVQASISASILL